MSDEEGPPNHITRPSVGCCAAIIGMMIAVVVFFNLLISPTILRSDRPLSVSEARKVELISDFDFPDSAHDLRFAYLSGGVALGFFLRFEAPVADCLDFAEKEMAHYNATHPNPPPPTSALSRLTTPVPRELAESSELNPEWFDVHEIKNGMEAARRGHKVPKVWVDLDRGVLYYMLTD